MMDIFGGVFIECRNPDNSNYDISYLKAGVYFVKIYFGTERCTIKRLIIN